MKRIIYAILVCCFLTACRSNEATEPQNSVWADSSMWYQSDNEIDANKIDVLYYISTEVLSAQDENGQEVWLSQLSEADRSSMKAEMAWAEINMFDQDYNFFAPYYHQFTFDAIMKLNAAEFDATYRQVTEEACQSFDYYMDNINQGRPFVLAGFSQGAMLTLDLLKHMTDEQYSRMVACYTIGYRLSAADLEHRHIKAAQGETDRGTVISFNSTQTREAIWPLVSEGACTCINPINWKTDATPATFSFQDVTNTVYVDQESQVLIVTPDDPSIYYEFMDKFPIFTQAGASRDNLHHWDLLFYNRQIHDNALKRAGRD